MSHPFQSIYSKLGLAAAALFLLSGVSYVSVCPCGPAPGLWLFGEVVETPVDDWAFANDVPLCQLEVSASWRPHSINLNCMSEAGALYVSCSNCATKGWSSYALNNPKASIRTGDQVYPVMLSRLTDSEQLDTAWMARIRKLGVDMSTPRPEGWWSFKLVSRATQ